MKNSIFTIQGVIVTECTDNLLHGLMQTQTVVRLFPFQDLTFTHPCPSNENDSPCSGLVHRFSKDQIKGI